jgi:hypothetical protein
MNKKKLIIAAIQKLPGNASLKHILKRMEFTIGIEEAREFHFAMWRNNFLPGLKSGAPNRITG